jgi:hypothetical protein
MDTNEVHFRPQDGKFVIIFVVCGLWETCVCRQYAGDKENRRKRYTITYTVFVCASGKTLFISNVKECVTCTRVVGNNASFYRAYQIGKFQVLSCKRRVKFPNDIELLSK